MKSTFTPWMDVVLKVCRAPSWKEGWVKKWSWKDTVSPDLLSQGRKPMHKHWQGDYLDSALCKPVNQQPGRRFLEIPTTGEVFRSLYKWMMALEGDISVFT